MGCFKKRRDTKGNGQGRSVSEGSSGAAEEHSWIGRDTQELEDDTQYTPTEVLPVSVGSSSVSVTRDHRSMFGPKSASSVCCPCREGSLELIPSSGHVRQQGSSGPAQGLRSSMLPSLIDQTGMLGPRLADQAGTAAHMQTQKARLSPTRWGWASLMPLEQLSLRQS